jgi:hypothetical protein
MTNGEKAYDTLDSLSAFWPGLQVLAGDIENAIKSHLLCEYCPVRNLSLMLITIRLATMEAACRYTGSLGHEL